MIDFRGLVSCFWGFVSCLELCSINWALLQRMTSVVPKKTSSPTLPVRFLCFFGGPIPWSMASINVECFVTLLLQYLSPHVQIIIYLHLKLWWWWLCGRKTVVDESELNHLMRHSIMRDESIKSPLKFKFVHHQLLAMLCDAKSSEMKDKARSSWRSGCSHMDGALICFVD